MSGYVEPAGAQHRVMMRDGVEQLRIPYRRQWFMMMFIPIWLAGWTAGGIAAMHEFAKNPNAFLGFWLCGWLLGWVFAFSMILAQFGAEMLCVQGGDLEVSGGAGPFRRTWRYRGSAMRNLQSAVQPDPFGFGMRGFQTPFWMRAKVGSVRFDYGSETVYLASGVDEPEGRVIVDWLTRRLPRAVTEVA